MPLARPHVLVPHLRQNAPRAARPSPNRDPKMPSKCGRLEKTMGGRQIHRLEITRKHGQLDSGHTPLRPPVTNAVLDWQESLFAHPAGTISPRHCAAL